MHGGHSSEFCEHATSTLREIVEAALEFGYHAYGISEHPPRYEERFLFPEEIARNWTVERTIFDFEAFVPAARSLAVEYADRITLLCGFEVESVPAIDYIRIAQDIRERYKLDYCVGSIHWLDDMILDYSPEHLDLAIQAFGGVERLAVRYYEEVATMVRGVKPEVVGHLDLLRKFVRPFEALETPAIQLAEEHALEAIREQDALLDINTAGYRKGLGTPYPAPRLLQTAVHKFGIGVCFGDDSHCVNDVGAGIQEARQYLLENGVNAIAYLTRENGRIVRKTASLR